MSALTQLRRMRVKRAELGGDGQDIPFEQAFSNLAHAYLRDKAPTLLDHEQGFQLLDRNQDNTKAVAVLGFRVGSHQLFAPVFFLQGDLKGHELLYMKNQDLFCPLKENWLNYILNRKPNILGTGVSRNTGSQLGVRQPELNRLAMSPHKFASAVPGWCREALPKFAATALQDTRQELAAWSQELHLPTFLKQASLPMLEHLVGFLTEHPRVAQALDEFHGLGVVSEAIKTAGARDREANTVLANAKARVAAKRQPERQLGGSVLDAAPTQHPIKTGALKVITFDVTVENDLPTGLTEDDQEKLLKDKVLIKDQRGDAEVSIPYDVQVEKKLFNPTETGLYQVLTKPGTFEKCFIALQPFGPDGREGFATLVRAEGTPDWCNAHPSKIWCCSRIENEEYQEWWDKLSSPDSLSTGGDRHMLIGQRGAATVPFRVEKSLGTADETASYEVHYSSTCNYQYDKHHGSYLGLYDDQAYSSYRDGSRLHLNGADGTAMRSHRGDLWVPKGAKQLTVEKSKQDVENDKRKNKAEDACCGVPCCGDDGCSEDTPLRPGRFVDAELGIIRKTKSLKLAYDGSSFSVNNAQSNGVITTLVQLVRDHGFREDTARELLKRAQAKRVLRCRVKYANPYLTDQGPDAPNIPDPPYGDYNPMGTTVPTQSSQEQNLQIPGMSASLTDRSIYNPKPEAVGDPMDAQKLDQAARSGQKEVFDTAMIGAMLKAVRDDTMIDRYLPDLIKGMDRIGRILFMFYWHGDKFADRYGKADMPELEDSLRNAFEMCGDCILFLKQKSIEPYPEEAAADTNLSDTAKA